MSQQARLALVNSPNTLFSNPPSQHGDLLNANKTNTNLIALLTDLCVKQGFIFYFTAIRSDHHDDSALGPHSHAAGDAVDGWFCKPGSTSAAPLFYDAQDPEFLRALHALGLEPDRFQTGLGGEAWTHADVVAAGSGTFQDNGADHVHIGATLP